jgi:vacuolar iron transporter family protein
MRAIHFEQHKAHRGGWLRAAVLGANDGVISVASLVVGVASGGAGFGSVALVGTAGLVAGAVSMAAGEYVSVRTQYDTEEADIARERQEHIDSPDLELAELTAIYVKRGLEPTLARTVAVQLTKSDSLGTHLRDELGISDHLRAQPLVASGASAASFAVGASVPLLAAVFAPEGYQLPATAVTATLVLFALGAIAGQLGGAGAMRSALRVTFWGILAMCFTYGVGKLFGAPVGG